MPANQTPWWEQVESLSNPGPTTKSWDPEREIVSDRREQEDLSVHPRWRRPLGYYALQDSRGNYVREVGGKVVAFRAKDARKCGGFGREEVERATRRQGNQGSAVGRRLHRGKAQAAT